MKIILVTTDFSPAARNASLYGLMLAEALGAKIILFTAYYLPNRMPSLNVGISEFSIMKDTEDKLAQEVLYLRKYSSLPIDIVCDKGLPQAAIKKISIEKNADFIIIGMKGAGQNFRKVFGSTVTELIRIADVPVIIVPENTNFNKPDKIVFANDMNRETDIHSLNALVTFTKFFRSKLFVVKVIKTENEEIADSENISTELRKAFGVADIEFEYPVHTEVSLALSDSIRRHNANLLVMITYDHDWLQLLFKKSETKEMIFHSHIPILIFPPSRFIETD